MELPANPRGQPMQGAMSLPLADPNRQTFYPYPPAAPQPTQPMPPPSLPSLSDNAMTKRHTVDGSLSPGAAFVADPSRSLFAHDSEAYGCWPQDPMDLDYEYDADLATWVHSWANPQPQPASSSSRPASHEPEPTPPEEHPPQIAQPNPAGPVAQSAEVAAVSMFSFGSMPVNFVPSEMADPGRAPGPDDLLFPDDETTVALASSQPASLQEMAHVAAPAAAPTPTPTPAATQPQAQALDLNNPATLLLYDQMLLFARGNRSTNEQLTFNDCNSAKEAVLHRLAMRLKLSYSYDPIQQQVCVWSPSTSTPPAPKRVHTMERRMRFPPPQAGFVSEGSSLPAEAHAMTPPPLPPPLPPSQPPAPLPLPRYRHSRAEDSSHKRHTLPSPLLLAPPQHNTNAFGLSMVMPSPSVNRMSADGASTPTSTATPTSTPTIVFSGEGVDIGLEDSNDQDSPSLSNRLSSSWSIFHSGISSRRPRGRRGPLSAKSRKDIKDLEWAGGACWRCKILRRKCDPGVPCKNCPAPDLREDAPPWPLIGCRRGSLREAMPPQVLCPKSRALLSSGSKRLSAVLAPETIVDNLTGGPPPGQPDVVSQCFREAEAQCLSDNKLVLDNPSLYLRARGASAAAELYSQAIRNGRYRANESLDTTCHVKGRTSTYAELLASIAWDLADNSECLTVLEIESVEGFMLLLETACVYEVEVGRSPMVALSIVCLRCCFDALRLNAASLLGASLHTSCQSDRCSIDCLRELASCVDAYIEELSLLLFRKVNLRDRRWWLSTFYSLCIQAYVRRALLVVEQQLLFPGTDDVDTLCSSQYLHLVTVLFIAVSFQYDPLVVSNGGLRLQPPLAGEDESPAMDMFVPDRYFAAGRIACTTELWLDEGIKSSYQFLTRLLNIGSLDFDSGRAEGGDVAMEESDAVFPLRRPSLLGRDSFSGYSTPNSSTTSFTSSLSVSRSNGLTSPPSSCGPLSSTSSPRTSLLVSDRRSSIGSLPSRLSVASFPTSSASASASAAASADVHAGRLQLPQKSTQDPGKQAVPSYVDGGSGGAANYKTGNGRIICTCCPKRPQHFDTVEELKAHQNKKPHICAFCGRRFSRMNEAERHITTIHLRPFSWSCGRLSSPLLAYQCANDGTTAYDVCGFCGRQFPRPACADAAGGEESRSSHAERLTVHVTSDHKIHECKAKGKKFFREDMFGQHLKLTHAAEPGIWLKYLENTCKADEKESAAAAAAATAEEA